MFHWLGYHSRHCCRYFFDWHLLHVKLHQAKVVHNVHDTHTRRHTQTHNTESIRALDHFIHFQQHPKRKSERRKTVSLLSVSHSHMRCAEHGSNVYRIKNVELLVEWKMLCVVVMLTVVVNGGLVKTTERFWSGLLIILLTPFIHLLIQVEFSHWYTNHAEWPYRVREHESMTRLNLQQNSQMHNS